MKLFFTSLLLAATLMVGVQPTANASVDGATSFVDSVAKETLDILNSGASKSAKGKKLERLLKKHVDIKWIGQFVMGKHWRTATKEQQRRYLKNYEDFILTSYAKRFTEYKGDGYKLLKSREDSNGKYTVKMTIDVDGKATGVDYKIRKKSGKYRIYDLNVEGVSLITTQRSEFNSIIQSKGIDYLISQLANKSGEVMTAANPK